MTGRDDKYDLSDCGNNRGAISCQYRPLRKMQAFVLAVDNSQGHCCDGERDREELSVVALRGVVPEMRPRSPGGGGARTNGVLR